MNILFVSSDNNRTSGAFLSLAKLSQLLRDRYQTNTLIILPNEGDGASLLAEQKLRYEIIGSRNWIVDIGDQEKDTRAREVEKERELPGNREAVEKIKRIIDREKIDLVHINTSYSYVGALAAKEAGVPLVWHIREFLEEDQNRKIWNRELGYKLMGGADRIVAISDSIFDKYKTIFPASRVQVIYNGIDEAIFYHPGKQVFKKGPLIFTIVGGVLPYKGQEELIRACGLLKEGGFEDFELCIVGKYKEPYCTVVREAIEAANLRERVHLCGGRADIAEILGDTDLLFVCSKNEAFGRTTVEGMMSGCVVVGADTAGTKELIKHGVSGYLYRQGDVKSLASCIEYIVNHKKEAEQVRLRGQSEAVERYTAGRNAEEMMKMYEDVLNHA